MWIAWFANSVNLALRTGQELSIAFCTWQQLFAKSGSHSSGDRWPSSSPGSSNNFHSLQHPGCLALSPSQMPSYKAQSTARTPHPPPLPATQWVQLFGQVPSRAGIPAQASAFPFTQLHFVREQKLLAGDGEDLDSRSGPFQARADPNRGEGELRSLHRWKKWGRTAEVDQESVLAAPNL